MVKSWIWSLPCHLQAAWPQASHSPSGCFHICKMETIIPNSTSAAHQRLMIMRTSQCLLTAKALHDFSHTSYSLANVQLFWALSILLTTNQLPRSYSLDTSTGSAASSMCYSNTLYFAFYHCTVISLFHSSLFYWITTLVKVGIYLPCVLNAWYNAWHVTQDLIFDD